jgi:hypothetical protein
VETCHYAIFQNQTDIKITKGGKGCTTQEWNYGLLSNNNVAILVQICIPQMWDIWLPIIGRWNGIPHLSSCTFKI